MLEQNFNYEIIIVSNIKLFELFLGLRRLGHDATPLLAWLKAAMVLALFKFRYVGL